MQLNRDKKLLFLNPKNKSLLSLLLTLILALSLNAVTTFAQEEESNSPPVTPETQGIIQASVIPVNPQTSDFEKFIYELTPGSKIEDEIWVINRSDKTNFVRVYPTFSYIGEEGNILFSLEKDEKKEVASWVTIETSDFNLQPNEWQKARFTIEIPDDVELKDYKGGFAVEKMLPANDQGIRSAFRKIKNIDISIKNDASGFKKEKVFFKPTPIFWAAVGLFVLSVGYFLWTKRKSKRQKGKK